MSFKLLIIFTIAFFNYALSKEIRCPKIRPTICTLEYSPVCGLFDPAQIVCVKAPCGMTYGNACSACADTRVISYTYGSCENYSENHKTTGPKLQSIVKQTYNKITKSSNLKSLSPSTKHILKSTKTVK